jgi:tetratricopeptide (TPR) repeat protein
MITLRTVAAASLALPILLTSGGCQRWQQRQEQRQADKLAEQEARDASRQTAAQAAQAAPEPGQRGAPATNPARQEPDRTRTAVIDERPSARYAVPGRPGARTGGDRVPAITPESVNQPVPGAATREAQALENARELRAMGDIRAALAELERAIAFNPRFTPALLEAGDLHAERGEPELAERSYAAAARAEPRNYDAQFRHATALRQLGRLDEATRSYLRALAVRPNDFDAAIGLSMAYLEAGNPEQALPYAQRASQFRPRSGEARMQLGTVLAALDRHEEAVVEFRQAAELLPRPAPGLLLNMAESFNRLGRFAEMVGALSEVVAAEPTPVAYERLGSGLFRLRRYDESLVAFTAAVALDPQYAPALNGVAVCELNNYLWSGKSDGPSRMRAVDAMRQSLRTEPSQPRIVELLRRYSVAAPEERRTE